MRPTVFEALVEKYLNDGLLGNFFINKDLYGWSDEKVIEKLNRDIESHNVTIERMMENLHDAHTGFDREYLPVYKRRIVWYCENKKKLEKLRDEVINRLQPTEDNV